MEKLLEQAKKFLDENLQFNEVELSDGINRVRVVRNCPMYWYPTVTYQQPVYTSQPIYP